MFAKAWNEWGIKVSARKAKKVWEASSGRGEGGSERQPVAYKRMDVVAAKDSASTVFPARQEYALPDFPAGLHGVAMHVANDIGEDRIARRKSNPIKLFFS